MALIKIIIKLVISVACLLILTTLIGIIISQVRSWGSTEKFDKTGNEFTGYGQIKYDLKGDRIDSRNVANCYFDRRICYDNTFGDTEENTLKYTTN